MRGRCLMTPRASGVEGRAMTAAAALPELLKFLAIVGAFFGACLALDRAFPPAPVARRFAAKRARRAPRTRSRLREASRRM